VQQSICRDTANGRWSCCHSLGGLTNDGEDTRAIQHYVGHRNITHTVRYAEIAAGRFNRFWSDRPEAWSARHG
jgi:site-specific recombinase XerD